MEPPKKKGRRFGSPTTDEKMEKICQGFVPPNTVKSTSWAVRVFEEWRAARNSQTVEEEQVPDDLLECPEAEALNYWLARFIVEARRADGHCYPASSLNNILAGLYRYSKDHNRECPNFMDRKHPAFRELSGAMAVRFRELREKGVGAVVKHAVVVTSAEEDLLWESGVIGDHSPIALQRAVFFYVGKAFCLRGGQEQRDLKCSQFVRSFEPDCYTYTECGSKNRSGVSVKETNKVVPIYGNPSGRPRCLVYLLDLYFSKFPAKGKEKDIFYLRPVAKCPSDPNARWYECAPVGRDKLSKFLETMCKEAGITEKKTNHSLRATGASALFHANVPDKLIREVTGHKSNSLELYERPTEDQRKAVSKVLVQGAKSFTGVEKENRDPPCSEPYCQPVGSYYNQCNFVINVGRRNSPPCDLMKGIDLKEFMEF